MGIFKETVQKSGKYKDICVQDGIFFDSETGEQIKLASELEYIYGSGVAFSLSTSCKLENDIEAGDMSE